MRRGITSARSVRLNLVDVLGFAQTQQDVPLYLRRGEFVSFQHPFRDWVDNVLGQFPRGWFDYVREWTMTKQPPCVIIKMGACFFVHQKTEETQCVFWILSQRKNWARS